VRENWFSGLTKHVPTLTRAGLSGNNFACGDTGPGGLQPPILGAKSVAGQESSPERAPNGRTPPSSRGGNVAWFN
jgi:hypothetical protein